MESVNCFSGLISMNDMPGSSEISRELQNQRVIDFLCPFKETNQNNTCFPKSAFASDSCGDCFLLLICQDRISLKTFITESFKITCLVSHFLRFFPDTVVASLLTHSALLMCLLNNVRDHC